jgi:hypothetical protein
MSTITYKPKLNVRLKNKITNDILVVDILQEEEIDGKKFWIARSKNRPILLAKEAYMMEPNAKR